MSSYKLPDGEGTALERLRVAGLEAARLGGWRKFGLIAGEKVIDELWKELVSNNLGGELKVPVPDSMPIGSMIRFPEFSYYLSSFHDPTVHMPWEVKFGAVLGVGDDAFLVFPLVRTGRQN